jgi:hypothetical protein
VCRPGAWSVWVPRTRSRFTPPSRTRE